jgi:hypothetical protein
MLISSHPDVNWSRLNVSVEFINSERNHESVVCDWFLLRWYAQIGIGSERDCEPPSWHFAPSCVLASPVISFLHFHFVGWLELLIWFYTSLNFCEQDLLSYLCIDFDICGVQLDELLRPGSLHCLKRLTLGSASCCVDGYVHRNVMCAACSWLSNMNIFAHVSEWYMLTSEFRHFHAPLWLNLLTELAIDDASSASLVRVVLSCAHVAELHLHGKYPRE